MLQFNHFNFNVLDLERSMAFYRQALELETVREKTARDGSFRLVYLGDGETGFLLELTWLRSRTEPYDLGEPRSSIWHFGPTGTTRCMPATRPWAACAWKTRRWASISSRIRTATGSRSSRPGSRIHGEKR